MESYLPYFPEEIQGHIRNQLPSYAKLSRNEYSGSDNLKYICYKDISKNEFITYIQEYKPNHFTIFYQEDDNYNIMDFNRDEDCYKIYIDILNSNGYNNITLETILPDNNQVGRINIDNIDDYIMSLGHINYDLISIYNIINNMRKGCNNIKSLMRDFLDRHLHKVQPKSLLESILNNIKDYVYITSAYRQLFPDRGLGRSVVLGLKGMIRRTFNYDNYNTNNLNTHKLIEFLNSSNDDRIKAVNEFINNLS